MREITTRTGGSTAKQIVIKVRNQCWKILQCKNIVRIESDHDFVLIFTRTEADETEEVFRVRTTMKNILNKLPGNFLRINSKDIINTDSVNHFENDSVILKTAIRLPISKNYRQEFAERMGRAYHCKMTHTKVYVIHGT